jgi:hypothetical protein
MLFNSNYLLFVKVCSGLEKVPRCVLIYSAVSCFSNFGSVLFLQDLVLFFHSENMVVFVF